jgi:RNA methyltransferase, TrmH family
MAQRLGAHSPRIAGVRALLAPKGRREQRRFLFEGPTLLAEAHRSSVAIEAVYATQHAYDETPLLHEIEATGVEVALVDDRTAARLSDVETPTGIVAVASQRLEGLGALLARPGTAVVLADLSDPGNAGAILRSAEAFGCAGAIFGRRGVEPYHPKVVRSAMGSLFRLPIAVADPESLHRVAGEVGRAIVGLSIAGQPLERLSGSPVIVVGQESHGLGPWARICSSFAAIPMRAGVESLNAAVAASIALFEASRA